MKETRFITFEGIDGCGKTTQLKKVESYLKERGINTFVGHEPGDTSYGGAFRMMLKRPEIAFKSLNEGFKHEDDFPQLPSTTKRNPLTELCMFIGARSEYVNQIVIPNLLKGTTVLSDRFLDSTPAYQGGGKYKFEPNKMALIKLLNQEAVGTCMPDRTYYFDINYETMIKRAEQANKPLDFIERSGKEFFQFTGEAYRRIANQEPERVKLLDGKKSIEDIFKEVGEDIDKLYSF